MREAKVNKGSVVGDEEGLRETEKETEGSQRKGREWNEVLNNEWGRISGGNKELKGLQGRRIWHELGSGRD